MNSISRLDTVASPALLFDVDVIHRNLALMLQIAGGDTSRLRPHIKTHKCREILALQLELGIRQVKCATIAEAELAALAGVPDVLVSYPLVGPNVSRFFQLVETYPNTRFSTLVDCERSLDPFAASTSGPTSLFVDLDCGMHRTGIQPGDEALHLVRLLVSRPEFRFAGIHAYDGHIHDSSLETRKGRFEDVVRLVEGFAVQVETHIAPVPLIVSGGSPTFGFHAKHSASSIWPWQCSPGTTVLWDAGYGGNYPDLPFEAAALLLTRVVSHPGDGMICVDLGHKAVAAENPINRRVYFPDLSDATFVSQSEEHLVLGVPNQENWPVGTPLVGIPVHVCPTVALHQEAAVVLDSKATGERWAISARDRRISI